MTPAGFPHSEIPGSKPVCGSPRLIAACQVLHRISAPRHPPCTLSSLTKLECILDSTNLSSMSDSVVKDPKRSRKLRPEHSRVRPESTTPTLARWRTQPRMRPFLFSETNVGATLSRSLVQPELESPVDESNKEPRTPEQLGTTGGADRNRTDDFRLAKAALSQLSYSPEVGPSGGPR